MANRKSKADRGISRQPDLFDTSRPEGSLDVLLGLKQLMSREMGGFDRYMVAAQISRLTGRDLSKEMLDKYVSSDHAYRPPADMLVAFCEVIGSLGVFQYLLEPLDSDVLNPGDRDLIELARLQEQERNIQTRMAQIRAQRGIR